MSKRKLNKVDGHDPWEIEVAYFAEHLKVEPIDARAIVVVSWMCQGDLRPLAAEIKKKDTGIDGAILMCLARAIDEGLLTVKPRRRGRPTQPATTIRNLLDCAAPREPRHQIRRGDPGNRRRAWHER